MYPKIYPSPLISEKIPFLPAIKTQCSLFISNPDHREYYDRQLRRSFGETALSRQGNKNNEWRSANI